MKNKNTTQIGDELRDKAFDLLMACGKQNIRKEFKVSGKRADIYYEDTYGFNRIDRVVIESKHYSSQLGVHEISIIITDYYPAKMSGAFDTLVVLSRMGLTSDGYSRACDHPWIIVKTFEEFYYEIINFREYVTQIGSKFDTEGLNQYYITPKDTSGNDIEAEIQRWINDPADSTPRAVLGGYGMGKTSLSLKVTKTYAGSLLDVTHARIPIYLRLADFVAETSVESLICKTFISTFKVEHFNYERFTRLNDAGQLLIIFDGFDEMKHAMPLSAFKRIFQDICKLATKKSKILVLGRPSAFTSENEKAQILHRADNIGSLKTFDPHLVDFKEIAIADFDKESSALFINTYFRYLQSKLNISEAEILSDAFREKRVAELTDHQYQDLVRRPVHARMLVELSLSHTEPMGNITRYDLYQKFIALFYEREINKQARSYISSSDRVKFIEQVAYHFWKQDGKREFNLSEIKKVKHNLTNPDVHKNTDDIYRELLIGSFLERKDEDYYYFSHRSFQEFLVASRFINSPTYLYNEFEDVANCFNEEILDFFGESGGIKIFIENCRSALVEYKGKINHSLLTYLIKNWPTQPVTVADIFESMDGPWNAYITARCLKELRIIKKKNERILIPSDSKEIIPAMCGMMTNSMISEPVDAVVHLVVISLHWYAYDLIAKYKRPSKRKHTNKVALETNSETEALRILITACKPVFNAQKDLVAVKTNVYSLLLAAMQTLKLLETIPTSLSTSEISVPVIQFKDFFTFFEEDHGDDVLQKIRIFWGSEPILDDFVDVQVKSNKAKKPLLTLSRSSE